MRDAPYVRLAAAPGRALVKVLTNADSPRQIALGFALGMLVGLVPKGNLIAITLATVLLASRANLGAGALSALLFTWVGFLADPISHRIGLGLLQLAMLRPAWTWLYNLPLLPWTAFNNTVVLGSLILGLALLYPVYRAAKPAAAWAAPRLRERLMRYHVGKVLFGAEVITRGGAA